MYESPIELITTDIASSISKQLDNDIYQAVIKTGVNVDKDELIKALKYDREQYEKGYRDGYEEGMNAMKNQIILLTHRLEGEKR
jgi:hypothetical protein